MDGQIDEGVGTWDNRPSPLGRATNPVDILGRLADASSARNEAILDLLLTWPDIQVDGVFKNGSNILVQVSIAGQEPVVRPLLPMEVVDVNQVADDGCSPLLFYASQCGPYNDR